MGTRGAYGFIKHKDMKVSYNHFDSYLEGLGTQMVDFIKSTSKEDLNKIYDNIILVNQTDIPTEEQNQEITDFLTNHGLENKYKVENFGNGKRDWYYLLRNCQGEPQLFKDGLRYMTDDKEFIEDNLFCEYSYLIDLDNDKFIIQSDERKVVYDLDNIPDNWIESTYPKLENSCKNKYMDLMFDKDASEQKKILKELGIDNYVKSSFDRYNFYTIENNYNDVLDNIKEEELEGILDNYLNKDLEVA